MSGLYKFVCSGCKREARFECLMLDPDHVPGPDLWTCGNCHTMNVSPILVCVETTEG